MGVLKFFYEKYRQRKLRRCCDAIYNYIDLYENTTNADVIRNMTIDELASEIERWMCGMQDINCKEDIIKWLEKKVEE